MGNLAVALPAIIAAVTGLVTAIVALVAAIRAKGTAGTALDQAKAVATAIERLPNRPAT